MNTELKTFMSHSKVTDEACVKAVRFTATRGFRAACAELAALILITFTTTGVKMPAEAPVVAVEEAAAEPAHFCLILTPDKNIMDAVKSLKADARMAAAVTEQGIEEDIILELLADDTYSDQITAFYAADISAATAEDASVALQETDPAKEETKAAEAKDTSVHEIVKHEPLNSTELPYAYNDGMCLTLSESEFTMLCKLVEAEACGEDIYGKMLVTNVVINRVNDKHFPGDVESVIFQKIGGDAQFAPTVDGNYKRANPDADTVEAVERVLGGEDYSEGALYFFQRSMTTSRKASWFDNKLQYLFKYGCHEFYKEFD